MRAKFIFEFQRGAPTLKNIGIGQETLMKQAMEKEGEWVDDERVQLLWAVKNNHIPFVVYLFEKDNPVYPGDLGWRAVKELIRNGFTRFYKSIIAVDPISQDMKDILYYYERGRNMTEEKIKYFLEKYGVKGIKRLK